MEQPAASQAKSVVAINVKVQPLQQNAAKSKTIGIHVLVLVVSVLVLSVVLIAVAIPPAGNVRR